MSDVAKWALLVGGALVLLALILQLPFVRYIDLEEFVTAISYIVNIAGDAFVFARGLINNFFLPFGRQIITGLMIWFLGKWALLNAIKIGAWIYHYVFK